MAISLENTANEFELTNFLQPISLKQAGGNTPNMQQRKGEEDCDDSFEKELLTDFLQSTSLKQLLKQAEGHAPDMQQREGEEDCDDLPTFEQESTDKPGDIFNELEVLLSQFEKEITGSELKKHQEYPVFAPRQENTVYMDNFDMLEELLNQLEKEIAGDCIITASYIEGEE